MMGHSHAVSGALGWLVVATPLSQALNAPLNATTIVGGAIICSGAALLPDLDHPSSTIARSFGPVSEAISRFTAFASGGHRNATHSIFFAVLAGAAMYFAIQQWPLYATLAAVFFFSGLAFRGLHLAPTGGKGWLIITAEAAVMTILVYFFGAGDQRLLPAAVAIGCILHLVGDSLTPGGVPWFWPWRKRFKFPIIPETGSFIETKIITPIMMGGIMYLLWTVWLEPLKDQIFDKVG